MADTPAVDNADDNCSVDIVDNSGRSSVECAAGTAADNERSACKDSASRNRRKGSNCTRGCSTAADTGVAGDSSRSCRHFHTARSKADNSAADTTGSSAGAAPYS